jgi:hypothetical protein
MPLDTTELFDGLLDVAANPGPDIPTCAQQWADAVEAYATAIVPASTTVSTAASALKSDLEVAFAVPLGAAPLMETAFATFATTVGTGMAPAFTATPPPGPVGFATQFALFPATHALAATALTNLIDAWAKTGTATPSGGGSPQNWA